MNFLVYISFALIYILWPVKATPGIGLLQTTSLASTPTCGATGNPLLACLIVQTLIISVSGMCKALNVAIEAIGYIPCVRELVPGPLGDLFQSLINGISDGFQMTTGACSITLGYWRDRVVSRCPGFFNGVDDILSIVL